MQKNSNLWLQVADKELPCGGTSNAFPCPKCGRAGSFSVTKQSTGIILFFCHRASCACRGIYGGHVGTATRERGFQPRVYTGALRPLDMEEQAALVAQYGVQGEAIERAGWRHGVEDDRLVMPVLSPFRGIRGHIARRIQPGSGPKTLTYKGEEGVFIGWYTKPETVGRACIIVEDLVSALRASEVTSAVALLGTHLNWDMVREVTTHTDKQIICLDKDATGKAFDYKKQFGLVGNFSVYPLSKDIKDMNNNEYREWRSGVLTTMGSN